MSGTEAWFDRLLANLRAFRAYWRELFHAFSVEVRYHRPILAALLATPFVSGLLLYLVESGHGGPIATYGDAVYATWITMTTVGYGELIPVTPLGKVLVSVDALIGLVVVGIVVTLFGRALGEPPEKDR